MRPLFALVFVLAVSGCGPTSDSGGPAVVSIEDEEMSPADSAAATNAEEEDVANIWNVEAERFDQQVRAGALSRRYGVFELEDDESVVDVSVFAPGETKTYTVEADAETQHVRLFVAVDMPPMLEDLNPEMYRSAAKVEVPGDPNAQVQQGTIRVVAAAQQDPPYEVVVTNTTDRSLLFQVQKLQRDLTEQEKQRRVELAAMRERAAKQDKFDEAMKAWRENPEGDAPRREDFGL